MGLGGLSAEREAVCAVALCSGAILLLCWLACHTQCAAARMQPAPLLPSLLKSEATASYNTRALWLAERGLFSKFPSLTLAARVTVCQ